MKRGIGQDWYYQKEPCPKEAWIQTRLVFSSGTVSERREESDKIGITKRSRVRKKRGIGQDWYFQKAPCPKEAWIQTRLVFSSGTVSESSSLTKKLELILFEIQKGLPKGALSFTLIPKLQTHCPEARPYHWLAPFLPHSKDF